MKTLFCQELLNLLALSCDTCTKSDVIKGQLTPTLDLLVIYPRIVVCYACSFKTESFFKFKKIMITNINTEFGDNAGKKTKLMNSGLLAQIVRRRNEWIINKQELASYLSWVFPALSPKFVFVC